MPEDRGVLRTPAQLDAGAVTTVVRWLAWAARTAAVPSESSSRASLAAAAVPSFPGRARTAPASHADTHFLTW
ncbi:MULTISPECIES: hypothetical protein [unclassified Streptomyces]|uniref:hypothetical protein n=1 Tax=unclassified Streptomyces TaxID=2593676 RepID=UPI0037FFBEB2